MDRSAGGALPGPGADACTASNPARPATEPHLADMTTKAIDLLSSQGRSGTSRKGFFLQVEGASIDKQDHAENPCGQIGETVEFDRAIQVGLDWAKRTRHADRRHRRPRPHQPDHRSADGGRPQPRRDRHADHGGRPADGRELRDQPQRPLAEPHRHRGPRRGPGPAGGQRRRASPTRPTCSTPWRARSGSSNGARHAPAHGGAATGHGLERGGRPIDASPAAGIGWVRRQVMPRIASAAPKGA